MSKPRKVSHVSEQELPPARTVQPAESPPERQGSPAWRQPVWLLLGGVCLWLALLGAQALLPPFDGYVPSHVNERGGMIASGPLLAGALTSLAPFLPTAPGSRPGYIFLLIVVPFFSLWLVARIGTTAEGRGTPALLRWCLAASLVVGLLNLLDLPYLSNDLYLYRAYGEMLARAGCNPYVTTPAACLPADVVRNVCWPNQTCAYGPLPLMMFAGVSLTSTRVVVQFWLLKLLLSAPWFILLGFTYLSPAFRVLSRLKWLAWMGLNPLLLLEVCQNGHLEGWLGLFLLAVVLLLAKPTSPRVALAGAVFGLACAVKLSVVVAAPVIWTWLLWSAPGNRRWGEKALLATGPFSLLAALTLAGLYLPLWEGMSTFGGLHYESRKVLRSLFSVLGTLPGMTSSELLGLSVVGNIGAALLGGLVAVRRRSLPAGLAVCLLTQAIFGRTFLQPWHLCPLLLLVPALQLPAKREPDEAAGMSRPQPASRGLLRFLLIVSASAIAGGYAVLFLARSVSPEVQALSFFCMLAPPLLACLAAPAEPLLRRWLLLSAEPTPSRGNGHESPKNTPPKSHAGIRTRPGPRR